jgi:hypothetical protein
LKYGQVRKVKNVSTEQVSLNAMKGSLRGSEIENAEIVDEDNVGWIL